MALDPDLPAGGLDIRNSEAGHIGYEQSVALGLDLSDVGIGY